MFFSFRINKETKYIFAQIKKKIKRAEISLSKINSSKKIVTWQKLLRTLKINYKIFDNNHLKFG